MCSYDGAFCLEFGLVGWWVLVCGWGVLNFVACVGWWDGVVFFAV